MNPMAWAVMSFGLAAVCQAQGGGMAEVAIIDRDSGAVLSPHYYRGEYWVAGKIGARYAIEIRNRLGERILAVTSVDGINVISGAAAGWDQTGYVFGPSERYQITGWRKSGSEVAAFTFSDSADSYAQRTGRPANVGVIGVAVFRERPAQPTHTPPMYSPPTLGQSFSRQESSRAANAEPAPAAVPVPKLGTGHGEREVSYVDYTDFTRLQAQPNEVIRIHYDSLDNLVAMGIVRPPRAVVPRANPFPASPDRQYVPDPPG